MTTPASPRVTAVYDIESPKGVAHAAAVLAGEQSTGTFLRLASETDALRDRSAARRHGANQRRRGLGDWRLYSFGLGGRRRR
jgi:ribulose 1,5-bisphosphate carboxylase large subunit-like protein